ncbi:esterase-like activity of phytase family protein [Palleronia rufa]|uniref:esterase-like activity of phytase family protein n=1 Tax=Palleronia rufa TaxID=1530186 RepID=UPI00068ECB5D|nr:esterase-like activity of phytase family protein [Palleronia rufa]
MPGRPRALSVLALAVVVGCAPADSTGGGALTQIDWNLDLETHGGFSAIEVDPGGTTFTVLNDQGQLVDGRFVRGSEGQITAIESEPSRPLRGITGELMDQEPFPDSEGLARDRRGRLYVSFEQRGRVWRYDTPDGPATTLGYTTEFALLPNNKGLEGLAVDDRNRVWTIAELPGPAGYTTWIREGREWRSGPVIPTSDDYSAVGMDFDDEGRLYLLERALRGIFGFQSRVRRFTLPEMTAETLLTSEVGQFDNLEGLSVWRSKDGKPRITMISDDNFIFFQTTEFVELALED